VNAPENWHEVEMFLRVVPVVCLDGGKRRDPKRAEDATNKKSSSVQRVYMQVKYTRYVRIAVVHVKTRGETSLT
jgi:hypothetical protein